MRRPNIQHEGPSSHLGSGVGRLAGGVEIPSQDRRWVTGLVESFKGLDPEIQKSITLIIAELRKTNPERATEVARRISDFFQGIGDSGKGINQLLEEITVELNQAQRKQIQ
jgi:hypothetical protein